MKQLAEIEDILKEFPSGILDSTREKRLHQALQQISQEFSYVKRRADHAVREKSVLQSLLEKTSTELKIRYQTIFENSGVPMIFLDKDGRILLANSHFSDLTGYSPDEIKKLQTIFSFLQQCDHQRFQKFYNAYFDNEDPNRIPSVIHVITRTGAIREVELNVGSLPNKSEIVISLLDVTERNRQRTELIQYRDNLEELVKERTSELAIAKEQAESANRAKSIFLSSMSHELRTPLNAILGYAQILKRQDLPGSVMTGLDIIQSNGEHLLTLITEILDLAKIEAGKMELIPTTFHLMNFLVTISNSIRIRAEMKGLTFILRVESGLPAHIIADETRLRQILLNLLGNAIKYTNSGSITFSVARNDPPAGISSTDAGPAVHLHFTIQDTGIGIAPEHINHIFNRFEQVGDPAYWKDGTGLGLEISRNLLRLMGSDLSVESALGYGTTFWFDLNTSYEGGGDQALESGVNTIVHFRGEHRRVLVVDDIASNRMVIRDMLTPLGFEILEAIHGTDGIGQAKMHHPDLVLMDLWMPEMDGFSALQEMRTTSGLERIPVIAMSASVTEDIHKRAFATGFVDFLEKPVSWLKLSGLLEQYLDGIWEYQKSAQSADREGIQPGDDQGSLIPPSDTVLKSLLELARCGDVFALIQEAERIKQMGSEFEPFGMILQGLAEEFEITRIRELIESCLGGEHDES